jgi:chemotaxis signal transduction protein
VIVLDIGAPIGLLVDSVENLETVSAARIETEKKAVSAAGGEQLVGAFATNKEKVVAKILDIKSMLESAFKRRQPR